MNDPLIGRTIGRYRIVEHLGRGGYDALQPGNMNWTATVRLYASGGDGNYTYAAPNPDGGFDYQRGPDAFFVVRSRRCKTWLGEFRVNDASGNFFAQSYSVEPPAGCMLP